MYAVVQTHNFDPETYVTLFLDDEDASDYLRWLWNEYVEEEKRNESDIDLNPSSTFCENDYARCSWHDGCETEFFVTMTTEPDIKWVRSKGV